MNNYYDVSLKENRLNEFLGKDIAEQPPLELR